MVNLPLTSIQDFRFFDFIGLRIATQTFSPWKTCPIIHMAGVGPGMFFCSFSHWSLKNLYCTVGISYNLAVFISKLVEIASVTTTWTSEFTIGDKVPPNFNTMSLISCGWNFDLGFRTSTILGLSYDQTKLWGLSYKKIGKIRNLNFHFSRTLTPHNSLMQGLWGSIFSFL